MKEMMASFKKLSPIGKIKTVLFLFFASMLVLLLLSSSETISDAAVRNIKAIAAFILLATVILKIVAVKSETSIGDAISCALSFKKK